MTCSERVNLYFSFNYAHSELKLNKLVATCSVNNIGSYKLLEKIGFNREGCLRQNSIISNQYIDDYVYGLCLGDVPTGLVS
ncbi:GNAT family N-acetyltransferase [Marinagarivorans algicola]|uniref:GNAT family N-acetyltransferase n=1 Tax=Marinagarivorans algicola TaxID=1513270 RepID=UPI0037364216